MCPSGGELRALDYTSSHGQLTSNLAEFMFITTTNLWAALVMVQSAAQGPITSAPSNLQGVSFTDNNPIAAGRCSGWPADNPMYLRLQRHFVRSLALGVTKD